MSMHFCLFKMLKSSNSSIKATTNIMAIYKKIICQMPKILPPKKIRKMKKPKRQAIVHRLDRIKMMDLHKS